jgi:hypothetical protein
MKPCESLLTPFQFRRRREMRGQNCDGYGAIKPSVEGAINFSHAARAKWRLNFVGAEFGAGG